MSAQRAVSDEYEAGLRAGRDATPVPDSPSPEWSRGYYDGVGDALSLAHQEQRWAVGE